MANGGGSAMCAHSFARSFGLGNRHVATEGLEYHAAEGIDVGPAVDRVAVNLLRGYVVERPTDSPEPVSPLSEPARLVSPSR